MLTIDKLLNYKFKKKFFNGIDENDVNILLNDIISDYEEFAKREKELLSINQELNSKVAILEAENHITSLNNEKSTYDHNENDFKIDDDPQLRAEIHDLLNKINNTEL